MACVYIAEEYASKHWSFGPKMNSTLALLMFASNVTLTIWPNLARQFPKTVEAIWHRRSRLDRDVAWEIDPPLSRAQDVLRKYVAESSDAEARALETELDKLTELRRQGAFTPADQVRENELLDRCRSMIERVNRIEAIARSGSSPKPTAEDRPLPTVPKSSVSVAAPSTSGPNPQPQQNFLDLRALINSAAVRSDERNIAIVIEASGPTGGLAPQQALYGHLKLEKGRLVTDLFKRDFWAQGYFDQMYQGNKELLQVATAVSHVDYVILGRLNSSFRHGSPVDDELVSCDLVLSYKVVDNRGDMRSSDSFSGVGAGFSEGAAIERAIEFLAKQFNERVLKPIS